MNQTAALLDSDDVQVVVAATEETPRYLDLLACRAAMVSYADFFYGRLTPPQVKEVQGWRAAYHDHPRLQVLQQTEPTLTDLIRAMEEREAPDVLVVDHLHCLARENAPMPQFLDRAMRLLPEWAAELDMAVILLAQVHRPQSRDPLYAYRIPTPTSGMGSAKIEHSADVLLGLSRKLKDDVPKDALGRLAKGLLKRGESVRDYEEPNTARVTVLKHRMDDAASRRSVLLTVNRGKLQDRLAVVNGDEMPLWVGDAWESP